MKAFLVVGLGYGDCGKGSIVDYLVRRHNAKLVVRYNGGSQAAHTVVTLSGQTHTFAQFGSGTLVPGVKTHLSRYMKIDPLNMLVEHDALCAIGVTDAFRRTTIDRNAIVITPFQKIANKIREAARGTARHGSCGLGIGETQADYNAHKFITIRDLANPPLLRTFLLDLQRYKYEQLLRDGYPLDNPAYALMRLALIDRSRCDDLVSSYSTFLQSGVTLVDDLSHETLEGTVIFEGAQGILLDQDVGFHPYTTWSTTTTAHAEDLLRQIGYSGQITRLGVTRTYATRHGPGPFVTEDKTLTDALPDTHNHFGEWQREFRVGHLDLVMLRYAIEANGGLDALAITHTDKFVQGMGVCTHYAGRDGWVDRLPLPTSLAEQMALTERLSHMCYQIDKDLYGSWDIWNKLSVPIMLSSYGPTAHNKMEY